MKRIRAFVYTKGKFGKGFRETLDRDNQFLYSGGYYRTKIKAEELPPHYCPIHSRSIWYMDGFVRTEGVKYVDYSFIDENHLFKDDYIYISYSKPIRTVPTSWGGTDMTDYNVAICGNDIIPILFYIEKFSPDVETSHVRKKILQKVKLYREHYPEDFNRQFKDPNIDIFEYFKQWANI